MTVAVHVRGPDFAITCATDDIGARGCRLVFAPAPAVGSALEVRLHSEKTSLVAEGSASVAWVSGGQMGLVFARPLVANMLPFIRDLLGGDEPLETPHGS
jgi:hypothetical protein